MTFPRATLSLAAVLLLACSAQTPATPVGKAKEAKQVEPKPEETKPETTPASSGELTAEELALIEADPKTLTPEQNRKRGYALRKKVMQDPNSEGARALEEAKQAALAGQIEVPGQEAKPRDNGVVIPLPEHLANQDQSYGKPATE